MIIQRIKDIVFNNQFSLQSEKLAQSELEILFLNHNINFHREYRLNNKNIIDFYLPDERIGIELKVKGSSLKIYKQLERYCKFDDIDQIVLITNKSMGLPSKIEGKDVFFIPFSIAYL
tara:strand:+ start:7627 stop:7980 length:354 start_codon:yes stop_codon:yes gene_type:complete